MMVLPLCMIFDSGSVKFRCDLPSGTASSGSLRGLYVLPAASASLRFTSCSAFTFCLVSASSSSLALRMAASRSRRSGDPDRQAVPGAGLGVPEHPARRELRRRTGREISRVSSRGLLQTATVARTYSAIDSEAPAAERLPSTILSDEAAGHPETA